MGYKIDILEPAMKHQKNETIISDQNLKNGLWYYVSGQSYIQRETTFDKTWLDLPSSNDYIALFLSSKFKTNSMFIYDDINECDKSIDSLEEKDFTNNQFHIYVKNKSLFMTFWESIRNALAHGSFNYVDDALYVLNQIKVKPEAQANFLLQTKTSIDELIDDLMKFFNNALVNPVAFKYQCLEDALKLQKKGEGMFSERMQGWVFIDPENNPNSPIKRVEVERLQKEYSRYDKSYIIISNNSGNMKAEKLVSSDGKVTIIPQNQIVQKLGLNDIKSVFKSTDSK